MSAFKASIVNPDLFKFSYINAGFIEIQFSGCRLLKSDFFNIFFMSIFADVICKRFRFLLSFRMG